MKTLTAFTLLLYVLAFTFAPTADAWYASASCAKSGNADHGYIHRAAAFAGSWGLEYGTMYVVSEVDELRHRIRYWNLGISINTSTWEHGHSSFSAYAKGQINGWEDDHTPPLDDSNRFSTRRIAETGMPAPARQELIRRNVFDERSPI